MGAMFDLHERVALITGGSRGLGREIAFAYARAGATVVVASRKQDACVATAAEISQASGREALGLACHVGRWAECDALADAVRERYGRIDILVNNAGLSPLYPSLAEVTEELFDKVLAVNLKGAFRLSSLIGTRMVADGGGCIINVSSIGAISPSPVELPYAAAKAGLNALTAGMARTFAPTVRVNGIMPGPFLTDIAGAWDMDAFNARAPKEIALQRGGEPGEIVGAALYLASDAASYTTGTTITVDGGMTSSRP
ncbi:MAG TPA: glucose 1-dehydrogenase [Solirubrobacteraceae bacterium]|jgi:NAD(P)-dependent dehydrogenase (short-subunit alcohol dehydrogenase family)|nr:glucose 1-dehydrogenase [Solirubrobacteraceae bacterium]